LWCLNGTTNGDAKGSWTFENGCGKKSVVDYCFVDNRITKRVVSFQVGYHSKLSDHHPIILDLELPRQEQQEKSVEQRPIYSYGFQLN